jgi:hypothetical protein
VDFFIDRFLINDAGESKVHHTISNVLSESINKRKVGKKFLSTSSSLSFNMNKKNFCSLSEM